MDKDKEILLLNERISKLAQEKSQLSLLNEMFANFERTATLEDILDTIINDALALHGGQNVVLYYFMNAKWNFKDLLGNKGTIDIGSNANLLKVIESRTAFDDIENLPPETKDINIQLDEMNACNSYFPLVVENEVLAILLLENRLIYAESTFGDFKTFFTYAGIVLKNVIENTTRLESATARFDQIFQSNLDGILLVNSAGVIVKCNKSFKRLFKCSEDNIGKSIYDKPKFVFLSGELENLKKNELRNVEFDHHAVVEELDLDIYCIVSISVLLDALEQVSGYIINVKDITARQKVRLQLEASNKRISLAAKAARLGYFEMNLLENTLEWDELLCSMYGFDPESKQSKFEYFNSIIHPDDYEKVTTNFQKSLTRESPEIQFDNDYRIVINGNEVRHIRTNAHHVKNEEGKVVRIIGASQDITMQRETEEQIRESEQRYRLLHESAGLGIGYYSPVGVVISYNEIASKNMGGEPKDFEGKNLFELFPKEAAEEYMRRINLTIESSEALSFEDVVELPTHEFCFLSVYTKVLNAKNEVIGIQIISSDITEQKANEKALKESEERFDLAMQAANDGVWDWDLTTNEIYFSPRWKSMLGYEDHELENKLEIWEQLTEKKGLAKAWEMQKQLLNKEIDRFSTEFKMKHKEGHWVEILSRGNMLFNENGKAVRMVGTHADITEIKVFQKNLTESRERYRSLLENLPVGVFRSNLEGTVLSANLAMAEIYGFDSVEELLKRSAQEYYTKDTPREHMLELLMEKGYLLNYETKEHKKDGEIIWVSVNYRLVNYTPTANPKDVFIDGVLTDITQKKIDEKELVLAKEKAEESDRLKSAFLANMSHEIRTPMNGILGFLDLLNDPSISKSQQSQYLSIVGRSGERLLQTINDIIELSKIEAEQSPVNKTPVNVTEMLHYLHQFFTPEVEAKNMELILDNLTVPIFVKTDQNKLESILINLIKNAIKFTNSGFIKVGLEKQESTLRFFVQDTGKGIPADKLDLIFERFVQADFEMSRGYEGTGLGLSITKAYVEALGGHIWVESEVEKGSCFYFEIECELVQMQQEKNLVGDMDMSENFEDRKEMLILVAEDDEVSFTLIDTMLSQPELDIKLIRAENGVEAVELFKKIEQISLILMDIKMPVMDGLKATREIREIDTFVPIIAQTAFALPGDKEEALEVGCNEYITKPIKKADLLEMLKKYMVKVV